jgi:ribosomal protein S18 acetylase RimI-like enzyme
MYKTLLMTTQLHQLSFYRFHPDYFEEYLSWFADPELDQHLGPMEANDPWLDYVMSNQQGTDFAVYRDGEMVAEIGIQFPIEENFAYYITNLAVKPELRRQGVGSLVLSAITNLYPLQSGASWRCFVHENNHKTRFFLEKNKWKYQNEFPDEEGFFEFVYIP